MGMIELGHHQTRKAIEWFERAAARRADFAPAQFGLGLALREMGDTPAALARFKRAIELKHDYVEALLFAAELHAAKQCVIECDLRLESLFRRSFPAAAVQGTRLDGDRAWLGRFPGIEVQCAIGSLPRFLRRSRAAFPRHHGYLVPESARVERWRQLIGREGAMLNIGIAWRGGIYETRRELRSNRLSDWLPVLSNTGARFFSLQRGGAEELERFREQSGIPIRETGQALEDPDELAAAIAVLDLLVSVDNTTVHLAGALGQKVWVLLPASAEWRYQASGEATVWYPSARLFRQARPGDWETVVREVRAALDVLQASRRVQ